MKLLIAIFPLLLSLTTYALNHVENFIFIAKDSETPRRSISFFNDWTVVEEIHEQGMTHRRTGFYTIGDTTLWEEEGLALEIMFPKESLRYVLGPQSEWLRVSEQLFLYRANKVNPR